ncbi:hypothetical protein [Rhizobium leguminosarum]|uniref:hypothetical protein n=1 Tax=Rhizobium leguminosarum TaxID=384 RepID=UPI001C98C020|nr:hypothetical protein [Rhizobium leguminosarum]MBY5750776.1 hypothetical protein [Rhizobium leguminosarum]
MSDSDRKEPEPMDTSHRITHEQFTRFLQAKAPEKPCPECGVNDWATSQTPGDHRKNPYLQIGLLPGAFTDKVMPLHTLSCRNCGFVKMFSAQLVGDWVKKNA